MVKTGINHRLVVFFFCVSYINTLMQYRCMGSHFISEAKVSGRGQIAIPKAVKERLGITEGDYVVFIESDGDIVIRAGKLVWENSENEGKR